MCKVRREHKSDKALSMALNDKNLPDKRKLLDVRKRETLLSYSQRRWR